MTQIGLLLPSRETSMTGEHDAPGLVRFARAAEECVHWLGRYLDAGARHLVLRIGSLQADRQLDLLADALLHVRRTV
ncbi:hypothetical protein ACW2Q0_26960 [Nocardia sp. R16R-3T]